MEKITQIDELKARLADFRKKNYSIGFVPTMGALHQGHVSLVERAKKEVDRVVCSIFVNPTQFTEKTDLERYPRTPEADEKLLRAAKCDVLFLPAVKTIYPEPDQRKFDFGIAEHIMEGKFRPGHFNGVAQVVSKLLVLVEPDRAYFGQKDFQQLAIIKQLVRQLNLPVSIVGCPTVREPDGLAMSSRNVLLSAEERKEAPVLAKMLFEVKGKSKRQSVKQLKEWVRGELEKNSRVNLEYFEIVDAETLAPVEPSHIIDENDRGTELVACIAARLGKVRLIDNLVLFP